MRFGRATLAATIDDFEKRRERFRIAPLPHQLFALNIERLIRLGRQRRSAAITARRAGEHREACGDDGKCAADGHQTEKELNEESFALNSAPLTDDSNSKCRCNRNPLWLVHGHAFGLNRRHSRKPPGDWVMSSFQPHGPWTR